MENKSILIEMLIEKIEQYSKTSIELYKLKAVDKSTDIFASLVSRMIVGVSIALFFMLLTIGIALYLGDVLGKSYYGFFAVAGFYLFITIVLFIIRKPYLEKTFNNYMIKEIFKKK